MKIILSMIVRNEAHVISRCLKSVLPIIDEYRIVDTGSTDNTINVMKSWLAHLPGEIIVSPWQNNFALHRNEALPPVSEEDYVLIMDADDELLIGPDFDRNLLTESCYSVADIQMGMTNYRPHLFKRLPGIEWFGVRHEDVWGFPKSYALPLTWLRIAVRHEGDRAKNPRRFLNDAEALLKARKKIDRANDDKHLYAIYTSHIGQSFCDAKDFDRGIKYFKQYIKLPDIGNSDFTYGACLKIAAMMDERHDAPDDVVKAYRDAIKRDPSRIEAYVLVSFFLARNQRFIEARDTMKEACALEFRLHAINQMTIWWHEREKIYEHFVETAKLQEGM